MALVIGRLAQRALDLEARQKLDKELARAAIGILDRDDPIAWREERKQRVADGGHAGGKAGGGLGPFQDAHLFLERVHRGVGVAAIDVAGLLAARHLQPFVHVSVAKRDALHDRHLGGALNKVFLFSCPNGEGAQVWRVFGGHLGTSFLAALGTLYHTFIFRHAEGAEPWQL